MKQGKGKDMGHIRGRRQYAILLRVVRKKLIIKMLI